MSYSCYKCNKSEVAEEFERCPSCELSHKELCVKLDARPKVIEKKVKEELMGIKEIKQGINITTYISREDAANMGIQFVPKK